MSHTALQVRVQYAAEHSARAAAYVVKYPWNARHYAFLADRDVGRAERTLLELDGTCNNRADAVTCQGAPGR
jgi:hypothetical protein